MPSFVCCLRAVKIIDFPVFGVKGQKELVEG